MEAQQFQAQAPRTEKKNPGSEDPGYSNCRSDAIRCSPPLQRRGLLGGGATNCSQNGVIFECIGQLERTAADGAGQSEGTKSTPQKCGAGVKNSTPTRWPLSVASPRKTTRDSCSSCVKGLVRTTMAFMASGWFKYIRPPCALITIVSQASRKRRLSEFFPATTTRTRMKTRVLRRTLS